MTFAPFSAVYFLCYEFVKTTSSLVLGNDREDIPLSVSLSCVQRPPPLSPTLCCAAAISSSRILFSFLHPLPCACVVGGLAAGSVAAAATVPLDVIKTRIQVQPGNVSAEERYKHMWDCATRLWKAEGPRAFVQGVTARMLWIAPNAALGIMACGLIVVLPWKASIFQSGVSTRVGGPDSSALTCLLLLPFSRYR